MTIPGKGGRPRKWRSDTDRVRAYRARQRGDTEPPTLTAALDSGDDAAAAWEQVRQLGATVQQQHVELRRLHTRLNRSERDASRSQHRLAWLQADNDTLRAELAEARHQLDDLRRLIQLDDHQTGIRITPVEDDMASDVPAGNRADRRRAERSDRRTHRHP